MVSSLNVFAVFILQEWFKPVTLTCRSLIGVTQHTWAQCAEVPQAPACSDCRRVCFVSKIGYLRPSVCTVIYKWSDWICCVQTSPLWTGLSAWNTTVLIKVSVHMLVIQLYNTEVWRMEILEIHHLAIQTLAPWSRGVKLCRTRQAQLQNRLINITTCCTAVMVGFTVQREVWCHSKSHDWWEHVFLETSDDYWWCANFIMCLQTFVRLCGHPASCLVHQDTPIRWTVSVQWHKRHSNIKQTVWTEEASVEILLKLYSNQLAMGFGSDLQNQVAFFAVQT